MEDKKSELKEKIITFINSQGFEINPHLRPKNYEKEVLRTIHKMKRDEQINKHKKFLLRFIPKIKKMSINGEDLEPEKIELELIEIKSSKNFYSKLFFWWNLIWWSLPYTKPIGRQMRYFIWDKYHNSPFGLLGLQSPPLRSKVRDEYLGLKSHNDAYWINQSLYGQRIGALPPYNDLIGSKMVALSLVSNQVRDAYEQKYADKLSLIKKQILPAKLLFLTTTSAFGKSSVYSRLIFKGKKVSEFIGYTTGQGTFHISEEIYEEIIIFLKNNGIDVQRGYGTGPSRKLYLIQKGFSRLGIPQYLFHNIKRGYYIFLNVNNLKNIIHNNAQPEWIHRDFYELEKFWKKRWCIPRSKRTRNWRQYNHELFLEKVCESLKD